MVGADTSLVLRGGGNTSVKTDEADVLGRPLRVLRVKGSGSDLATIRRADFAGVRLDDVLPLFDRGDMTDESSRVAAPLFAAYRPRRLIAFGAAFWMQRTMSAVLSKRRTCCIAA